jgi:hypothetical protein
MLLEFDPFRVDPRWGTSSGGVAPGYYIDPLRGSRTNNPVGFCRSLFSPAYADLKVSATTATLKSNTPRFVTH